jgi:serine beta-lactamase-like protein LACTB
MANPHLRFLTLGAAFASVWFPVSAAIAETKKDEAPLAPAIIATVEAEIHALMETDRVPGLSVAIGWEGRLRYSKAFGLADVENQVAASIDTRFRTASIAKALTATAVMILVEKGKIDLEEDIRTYVPAFPEQDSPILVRHVLSHQSGIRHYNSWLEAVGTTSFDNLGQTLQIFAGDALVQEPGEAFRYTTFGYNLLGLAIENATGDSYEMAMRELIWKPAGMQHTGIDHHFEVVPHRARGYARLEKREDIPEGLRDRVRVGELIRAELHDTSMKTPGGGMLSTAEDLVRFGLAMQADRLVSSSTRDLMWAPAQDAKGEDTPYGMGWWMNGDNITHGGGQAGTSCMLAIRQTNGVVVAIMSNLQLPNGVPPLAERLTEMVGR